MVTIKTLFPDYEGVPREIFEVLLRVQGIVGTNAYLTGGAMRDLLHGKPIKDLDIFVRYCNSAMADVDDEFHFNHCYQRINSDVATYLGMTEVLGVSGYDMKPYPLNIIYLDDSVTDTLDEIITRNDFGICQVGLGCNGQIAWTEAFEKDVVNKTFTNTRHNDWPRAIKWWERLQEKYPGYQLIDAEYPGQGPWTGVSMFEIPFAHAE